MSGRRNSGGEPPPGGRLARIELLLALALVGIAGGPFLIGDGVDFPDDAIYHSLPLWEWLQSSVREGHSPWFVPGKLGGVSLAADSVPMGPLYPACWLLLVLPAAPALSLAMLLHALGTVLTVRWLARSLGVSRRSATLAGAGVVLGTTGVFSFVDCQADTMPLFLWFPAVLACLEHLDRSEGRRAALRWTCLAACALALMLLGSHLRWAAATGAALVLWCLLRRPRPGWTALALALGLLGGLPGFLPQLLEWRESAISTSRLGVLGTPAHNWVDLWNIAGILAPKPIHLRGDHSVGLVLGAALLWRGWKLSGPQGRLAVLAGLLFLVPLSTQLPGLRYLFAPLLLLTHPVNHFYAALATVPAAVAGGACLDQVLGGRGGTGSRAGRIALTTVGALVIARGALPDLAFLSDYEWSLYLLAAAQAGVLGALGLLLLRRGGSRSGRLIFGLGLLDLALVALRLQLAIPSTPLPAAERATLDLDGIESGYLHLTELADLEPFQYDETQQSSEDVATEIEEQSAQIRGIAALQQEDLLGRRWPVHLAMARGLRSASGFAKMPPRRAVAMLTPLADALVTDPTDRARLEEVEPERLDALFSSPSAIGSRTLALFGMPNALGPDQVRFRVEAVTPRCYLPKQTRVIEDEAQRIRLLLEGDQHPEDLALLESPLEGVGSPGAVATVDCSAPHQLEVRSEEPVLVTLRERHHPGWRLETAEGTRLTPFPVNQVHLGVVVPQSTTLSLRFVPPGLPQALTASGLAWLLLLGGLLFSRRRGHS